MELEVLPTDIKQYGSVSAWFKIVESPEEYEMLLILNARLNSHDAFELSSVLPKFQKLKTLCLQDNCFGSKGVAHILRGIEPLRSLTWMNLSNTGIGKRGACAIAKFLTTNATLTMLDLSGNPIMTKGACALGSALETNSALEILTLYACCIGDVGAAALAAGLKNNHKVRILICGDNPMGATGVSALAEAWAQSDVMETLDVTYTMGAQDAAIEVIKVLRTAKPQKCICLGDHRTIYQPHVVGGMVAALRDSAHGVFVICSRYSQEFLDTTQDRDIRYRALTVLVSRGFVKRLVERDGDGAVICNVLKWLLG